MSFIDKFLNVMRLSPDDNFYNDEEEDIEEEEEPIIQKSSYKQKKDTFANEYKEKSAKTTTKVTPIRPSKKQMINEMEVHVFKPKSANDAREIIETLLDNRTVVLNVEGLEIGTAQRIIDITSGSTLAINGNMQKISNYIFIVTPECVDISGDFLDVDFDVSSFS